MNSFGFSFQPTLITDILLLLLADTDKIADHVTFLYFKKKFIAWSVCTPEGKKHEISTTDDLSGSLVYTAWLYAGAAVAFLLLLLQPPTVSESVDVHLISQ